MVKCTIVCNPRAPPQSTRRNQRQFRSYNARASFPVIDSVGSRFHYRTAQERQLRIVGWNDHVMGANH